MNTVTTRIVALLLAVLCFHSSMGQVSDTLAKQEVDLNSVLRELRKQQINDSLERSGLREELSRIKEQSASGKQNLEQRVADFEQSTDEHKRRTRERVDSIRANAKKYAVAPFRDTLFHIYSKLGSSLPKDRAFNVSNRIIKLAEDDFVQIDSFFIEHSEISADIVYKDLVVTSVTELDALIEGKSKEIVAAEYLQRIQDNIRLEREDSSITKLLIRIGLVLLIIVAFFLFTKFLARMKRLVVKKVIAEQRTRLKDITLRNYVIVSSVQKARVLIQLINIAYWGFILLAAFLMLPVVFSIFPFTQSWANNLIGLFTKPLKKAFAYIIGYIPDLITVIVILFVMRYLTRFVKYIFSEIDKGKLEISGFAQEFAMPTFTIVRFLLYAFAIVLVFPYLPGSKSDIFKGVSVFIGILFSLGSSSAISNIVAGLVITYMRPFRIGDRITIADKTGVVLEKTPLVTRLRTVRNEEITIPNSSILSGNTINYSTFAEQGICFQVEVTVGYEQPWFKIQEMLLAIPQRIARVRTDPAPFVLQKKLDDFYVLYELNVYISKSGETDLARSEIYQHILNDFLAAGIEMAGPHLYAQLPAEEQYKPV